MISIEGLKEGTSFLVKYNEKYPTATLEEFKLLAFSREGVKIEKVNCTNVYDNKITWYVTENFDKEYVIVETLKGE